MLTSEKEHSMSRKEYLKKLKKSKMKFPLLKPILICIVIIVLSVYVIHQLHVYNTVTELANKMVEESKLIKTYKMYFLSKPYEHSQTDSILYLYTGTDESRMEIESGRGLKSIQTFGEYIYGLKGGSLIRINMTTHESEALCEENILAYNVSEAGVYVYRYYKSDTKKTGLYKLGDEEALIINKIVYQLLVDENNIYIVTNDNTSRTLIKYTLDGKQSKALTSKVIVNNIIQDDKYIYYTNSSDKNTIYRVGKDGTGNIKVTQNKCMVDTNKYNGNGLFAVYQENLIYINPEDSKVYAVSKEQEQVLVDNAVSSLQLNDKMLYLAFKDKIDIYRYNIEKSELEKITSARQTEMIWINN